MATNAGLVRKSSNFVGWGETTEDVRGLFGLQVLFAPPRNTVVLVFFPYLDRAIRQNAEERKEFEFFWRLQQDS